MKKEVILTENAALPKGPYSQAIRAGNFLFLSGQGAWDSKTGKLLAHGDITTQTEIIIKNVSAILKAGGSSIDNVVKVIVFINALNNFSSFNNVYKKYFIDNPPARSTVEIGNFEKGMCIEMDVIALVT